jgi:hypothetical protein
MNVDVDYLETRLNGCVPPAYRVYVRAQARASLLKQGFDPKTLLILNLELEGLEHHDGIDRRFFLTGDGCGNYYFVDLGGDPTKILLWAHDPPGIEDPGYNLAKFLRDSEQDNRIDRPVEHGLLWICRTPTYAESILDPITLVEWVEAVRSTEGLSYVGYRDYKNPFTGELIRADAPGRTAVLGHENCDILFRHGRARLDDSPGVRSIAATLANKLKANLLCAD